MRRFKWIEWNLQKIAAHGLSAEEVEAAFDRVYSLQIRRDGSQQMFAETPSGRRIWVIWRYDREDEVIPDVFGELDNEPIFVIAAYLEVWPMVTPIVDQRSIARRARDEQIASEPPLPSIELSPDATPLAMEIHLRKQRRPLAVAGVVENGMVRPLDPAVTLPELSRVIIVMSEAT